MEENISEYNKNLHIDNSLVNQPKGTTRFVLNGVTETNEGDFNFISNEESNEPCYELPDGHIPLGSIYIGNEETVIFSVKNDESISEIGIVDRNCNYTTLLQEDFGFKVSIQISGIFRLRRGCERIIYWTDPRLRVFNIDKPDQFKDEFGNFDILKFRLFKTVSSIPSFEEVNIIEGGNLLPGSYNAAIQYLDEDLNPTEWVTTSQTIIIYNDSADKEYSDIRGSTSKDTDYQKFGQTNKAIVFNFSNLDRNFPFYRVGIIEANNGSGQVSRVAISSEISTQVNFFTYTGNASSIGTIEEVQAFNNIIEFADHIDQIENRLILANTKGKKTNLCRLQKYASKIQADLTLKEVILNTISKSNPKTGTVYFDGTGYMPGEIYSFGIVWIFEDGTQTPVYHIPGKNHSTENFSFTQEGFPMSIDNELSETFYVENNSCGQESYWGFDSEGSPLINQKVRHHRFPTRSSVGLPLLTEDLTENSTVPINRLFLNITGSIDSGFLADSITISVEFSIQGNPDIETRTFLVASYDPLVGSHLFISEDIQNYTIIGIYEDDVKISGADPTTATSGTTGLVYNTEVIINSINVGLNVFKSQMFGVKFSNIEVPSLEDTNGEKIVGYFIVRNERDRDNRTILDTGVLTPLINENFYIGHAHLVPELDNTSRIKNDVFGLIHPEFSFFSEEYKNTQEIIKEGVFNVTNKAVYSLLTQDVMAGTSFDPNVHKRRERDSDGFSLNIMARDNKLVYDKVSPEVIATGAEIDEIFYLSALNSKVIDDFNDVEKEVFNVSSDNKVGIVKLDKELDKNEVFKKLPYVILKRTLLNPYSNFRVTPYYKEVNNPIIFKFNLDDTISFGDEVSVFNGDVVVTPLRYTTSSFYQIKIKKRKTKSGLFNFILAAISLIAGVILAPVTGGISLIAAIGFSVTQVSAGISQNQMSKVWNELYEAGLKDTIQDKDTNTRLDYPVDDDEVQWFSDTLTNLWFETTANSSLRQGATINMTDFLDAPSDIVPEKAESFFDSLFESSNVTFISSKYTQRNIKNSPQNDVDSYMLSKLTKLDPDNNDGRMYQGFANAELYEINLDYLRRNREKIFNHLALEYDCCSECIEEFPHRYHHSEQSFQEELSDNYRVFLPNNFRDVEGNSGEITNLYRYYNNLFIHTREALWHQPQNFQERVTNEIVSFIGTGSYFEIPPRKIVDDSQSSAGTEHKFGCLKTRNGILFPCELERKWYFFDGKSLNPISELGISSWFREEMPLICNKDYYTQNKREYPFLNNTSNPFGIGFISVYDTRKERLIVTKKDFKLSNDLLTDTDYEICTNGDSITIFRDFQATIDDMAAQGYDFLGIENCRMKFYRTILESQNEDRFFHTVISNTTNIHVMLDGSGSFNAGQRTDIINAIDSWLVTFQSENPDWEGGLFYEIKGNNAGDGENWLSYGDELKSGFYGNNTNDKDILLLTFINEANSAYHGGNLNNTIENPTVTFLNDYNNFVNNVFPSYRTFNGINYPIISSNREESKEFLVHSLAAQKGRSWTFDEVEKLRKNPAFSDSEWETLKSALKGNNPYPDDGLENYNWVIQENRQFIGGDALSPEQFAQDIEELLQSIKTVTSQSVEVQKPTVDIQFIDGDILLPEELKQADLSCTNSFSLKDKSWVSWHSYLPNFYFSLQDKFYSWINGNNFIWRHNAIGSYQTFFGVYHPFIVEYVSLPKPLLTKTWENIIFQTEAKQFDEISEEFVDKRFVTFNKILLYNTRQISGILNMIVKDLKSTENLYLIEQVKNEVGNIIIDRNERDWSVNEIRDVRVDLDTPMFKKDFSSLQNDYFIDKIVNQNSINFNKDWFEMELFRDKFLVIRFIFDNNSTTKLIANYSHELVDQSIR